MLTVREVIRKLEKVDPDTPVSITSDSERRSELAAVSLVHNPDTGNAEVTLCGSFASGFWHEDVEEFPDIEEQVKQVV
jgi:hypothetical protein